MSMSFSEQVRRCVADGHCGSGEGPEIELVPGVPNRKIRDHVAKHGSFPKLRASVCKRFGGVCSSDTERCRALRSAAN